MRAKDILTAAQFTRTDIEDIFRRVDEFTGSPSQLNVLRGKSLGQLYYEPSNQTRTSFENAMIRLGGKLATGNPADPGSFVDAVHDLAADVIVLRHPEMGSAQIAADSTSTPIINAGDGKGEHPTQALAELATILQEKKTINGLRIALVGDLKNGRTCHSLALLLSQFDVYVSLVAPAAMSLPYDLSDAMRARGITVEETNDLPRVMEKADTVILSRVEKRYFADSKQFEKMSRFFILDQIAAQKPSKTWLGGNWDGGDTILDEAYRITRTNGDLVRMVLLTELLGY